jgi:uncharacterized protein YkwD
MRAAQTHITPIRRGFAVLAVLLAVGLIQAPPASANADQAVAEMVAAINSVRLGASVAPLSTDQELEALAAERSADMAGRGYFSHVTPEGLTVFDLLEAREWLNGSAAENLALNSAVGSESAAIALQQFLASPPHRANLLQAGFSQIGVGTASGGGLTYFTVLLRG